MRVTNSERKLNRLPRMRAQCVTHPERKLACVETALSSSSVMASTYDRFSVTRSSSRAGTLSVRVRSYEVPVLSF